MYGRNLICCPHREHNEEDQVDDLAVDCANGGFGLWIFYHSGKAKLMNIYAPENHRVRKRYIGTDGLVYEYDESVSEESDRDDGLLDPKGKVKVKEEELGGEQGDTLI